MIQKRNLTKKRRTTVKRKQSHKWLELLFLLLFFSSIFLTISLIGFNSLEHTSLLGTVGADFASFFSRWIFGRYGTFAVSLIIFIVITWWITGRKSRIGRWLLSLAILGFFIGFSTAFLEYIKEIGSVEGVANLPAGWTPDWTNNGFLPSILVIKSGYLLSTLGTVIVAVVFLVALAIVLFNLRLTKILEKFYSGLNKILIRKPPVRVETYNTEFESDEIVNHKTKLRSEPEKEISAEDETVTYAEDVVADASSPRELPSLKLLNLPPSDQPEVDPAELDENARRLENKLASMRISATVIKINPGPIITRYDLKPAAEVKIARIVGLADDIAMALKARGVRILAPIPGEAAVGVEIANRKPQGVYIREIIGSAEFRRRDELLTIALGKDTNGEIFCANLAKMPHLLIAGATGSGKSVCINTIITSLLYRCDPKDVRIILIDPKKIELSLYSRLSEQHLVTPPGLNEQVITTPENAVKTLQSIHTEMERRYAILAEVGVRSLDEYNRWIDTTAPEKSDEIDQREHLPYLIVIIDELADLMMTMRRDFEDLIARTAQMARAVGIHLIVATQRPSVDVVTGLIKANFPARIAFRMVTKVDSRTIIDSMGAEALLGKGDMLFLGLGSDLKRLHGALVTTEEVERLIEFVRAQPPCESYFKLPHPEVQKVITTSDGDEVGLGDTDELFEEAAKIVVRTEQGSVSVLQRRLRVGYARAARLIDQLEQAGIVGPFDGSKARQVMVTPEELLERYGISL